jgi:hypothetical protein
MGVFDDTATGVDIFSSTYIITTESINIFLSIV